MVRNTETLSYDFANVYLYPKPLPTKCFTALVTGLDYIFNTS